MTFASLASALGQRLVRIDYVMLPWETEIRGKAAIDAVSRAVILTFEKTQLQVRWKLQPPVEKIVVEPADGWRGIPLAAIVSANARWSDFLGLKLCDYRTTYQHVESGREPWAFLLNFDGGLRLLIALGELNNGGPTYLPDSLVVTADALVATAYKPPASEGPPWQ